MTIFIVADTDKQNRPVDEEDLNSRIREIKALIPQPKIRTTGNNMMFVEKAFTLFKDCGLINEESVKYLCNENCCTSIFNVKMNPLGGVLRQEGSTMWDKNNLRYYCPRSELIVPSDIITATNKQWNGASKMAVVCKGVTYYISIDWFAKDKPRPTKAVFAKNLYSWAKEACEKYWTTTETETKSESTLQEILKSLEELHKKVDDLNEKVEHIYEDLYNK